MYWTDRVRPANEWGNNHSGQLTERSRLFSFSAALSLRYLDFGPGFTILSRFLPFLPQLVEVRIGSDAPPGMKGSLQRLRVDEEAATGALLSPAQKAALDELPKLKKLNTLVLKDFGGMEVIEIDWN